MTTPDAFFVTRRLERSGIKASLERLKSLGRFASTDVLSAELDDVQASLDGVRDALGVPVATKDETMPQTEVPVGESKHSVNLGPWIDGVDDPNNLS